MSIKILLADDHTIILDGLKVVLSNEPQFEVIGTVENGEEVLSFTKNNMVDVAVLDINMPVMDGLTCARILKKEHPDTKIIILTMYPQRSFTDEIIKIGVDGCLLKNNTGQELITAIHRVMEGKSYYDQIKSFRSDAEEVTQYKLTKRELEIIKCLVDGLKSYEISEKLFISEHTVRTHRKNILKKTGVASTAHLVRYAVENKLV